MTTRDEELKAIEEFKAKGKIQKLDPVEGADAIMERQQAIKENARNSAKNRKFKMKAAAASKKAK